MPAYRSSEEIYESIINYEHQDRNGLNGFILLVHIGTDERRTDKFYWKLDSLIDELKGKGYSFVRIDQLLE
jgi:peptidoglycan/xylan/chitin deacetylase (PgdA/CDA1 family)